MLLIFLKIKIQVLHHQLHLIQIPLGKPVFSTENTGIPGNLTVNLVRTIQIRMRRVFNSRSSDHMSALLKSGYNISLLDFTDKIRRRITQRGGRFKIRQLLFMML